MIILSATAFALDCPQGDTACEGANIVRDLVNGAYGGELIKDTGGKQRFRTSQIRSKIEGIQGEAQANGCTITGYAGADIDHSIRQFSGGWAYEDGNAGYGAVAGSFTPAPGTTTRGNLSMSWGDSDGEGGANFGLFEGEKLVADMQGETGIQGEVMVGHYARVAGKRLYGWSAVLTCDGDPAEAVDDWYPGDLSEFYESGAPEGTFITWSSPVGNQCSQFGLFGGATTELQCNTTPCVMTDGEGGFMRDSLSPQTLGFTANGPSSYAVSGGATAGGLSVQPGGFVSIFMEDGILFSCSAYGSIATP